MIFRAKKPAETVKPTRRLNSDSRTLNSASPLDADHSAGSAAA